MAKTTLVFALVFCSFSQQSFSLEPSYRSTTVVANALSVAGGLGLFAAATMNVVAEKTNTTDLDHAFQQVGATSMLCFAVGTFVGILAAEKNQPQLLERMDELASAFIAFGFSLNAAGIWTSNLNAIIAGSVTVSSFFASRALLLPLIIQKHPNSFRPSDRVLLFALTVFGNAGGLLLTWSNFEPSPYRRQLLQAGFYVLGVVLPVTFTGLTINLFRARDAS